MAGPITSSVHRQNRYQPPAATGLADLLDRQVHDRPDARALVVTADRVRVSYRGLATLVDDVADRLRSTGLHRGDPVGLISANNAEFIVGLLAAARAGLVVAPMDPALPEAQLSARLEEMGAQAILTGPPAVGAVPVAQVDVPAWALRVEVSHTGTATAALDTGPRASRHIRGADREISDQDALVLFTAGTTDVAKMVPLTHANVAASIRGICDAYELGPGDATVAAMPLFHGHGLFAALLASLASGGCVLLPHRGKFSAHQFWDDVRAVAATWFTAVPTIYEILLNRAEREFPGPEVAPLRFVRSCSAPLNTATGRAMERMLGVPLLSAYGMTETAHQAASEPLPQRGPLKEGSVGQATGVDLRVLDQDGHEVPAGTQGEVWVHGPTVARGYLRNPAETAHSFVHGWFRTGDVGLIDEDGYLFLTGRIKTLINRGGEKIAPEHVENVLAGFPGVVEAAVFAIPDPTYGQRVGAAVVLSEGHRVDLEEILRHCRALLPRFEVPDRVDIVAALPHTPKGSLDRRMLEKQYARSGREAVAGRSGGGPAT
jgi:acyl-CoA synthetase (AMP-forming)/AMP-acid ligase II